MTLESQNQHGLAVEYVLSLLAHSVVALDATGHIWCHSPAFAIDTGLDPDHIDGTPFSRFLSDCDSKTLKAFIATAHLRCDVKNTLALPGLVGTDLQGTVQIKRILHNSHVLGYLCQMADENVPQDPRIKYVMEHFDQGVWDYDTRTNFFLVSDAWRQMRGVAPYEEINVPNDEWLCDVHPEDREHLRQIFKEQVAGKTKSIKIQFRRRHAAGRWIWILCRASVVESDTNGRPLRIVGTDTDITDVKEREENLLKLTGKLQLAIEASGMGLWEFDPNTDSVYWDDRQLEIYGIKDGQNTRSGNLWATYIHPDDYEATVAYANECLLKGTDFKGSYRIIRQDGGIRYIRSLARKLIASGQQNKLIGVNFDVTEDHLREQELENARSQLEYDSRHDALTGLANRRRLDEMTATLFNGVDQNARYAVMHLDLDYFKRINDTLGHSAGDYVLVHAAKTIRKIVGQGGTVYRVGGDEFVVLFEEAPQENVLSTICERIINTFQTPLDYEGRACVFGASIGYAFGQGPPDNPSEIFINADTALYAAKNAGRSCYRSYSGKVGATANKVANARQDLVEAFLPPFKIPDLI